MRALARPWQQIAWLAFIALGSAMTIGYFMLPTPQEQDVFYQLPEMLAVAAILFGIRLHRPADARPWYLLAVGLALSTTGDWTWVLLDRVFGIEPFPSVADVFYLGGMAIIGLALWRLLRGRLPGGDRAGVLDALIVAVGAGMLTWVFLMAPIVSDTAQSTGELAVALAYPLIDIVLLGGLVRLLLAPGEKSPALRMVIGALIAYLLADYPYALMALDDGYAVGSIIDAGWILGAVLWGAAALHPSMRTAARPAEPSKPGINAWRVALLTAASLMAPAVLLIQWLSGTPIDVPVVATGCMVLFILVIARLEGVVQDLRTTLAQRTVLEEELSRRALHDPLTGLANRTLFHDRLQHALARRDSSVAVMFLDLDDFKTVNDAYGHAAGDTVLRAVASSLTGVMRPEDTVARLGGDEFAILLTDNPHRYSASLIAGRLLAAVQLPVDVAGHEQKIGASIGISLGASGIATAEDLMRDADIAMYVSKGQGKGTFTVFEPTEHNAVIRGIELRNDLEGAISASQFQLHYQPIIDLETGEIAGAEALVRWRHPTLGLLSPAEFITLAETTGAIAPLGKWILREACFTAAAWPASTFVAVNLSALQLAEPGFVADVEHILLASGVPAARLVLEVTETSRLDQDLTSASIRALREMGVRLAIDDFGTGYAGLTHLSRTPFDLLKIDRSFVSSMGADPRAESLVTGILDLARRLNVRAVAEGIEDGVQLARLREAGCALGQGFHFARPMPASELAAFLREAFAAAPASAATLPQPESRPA